MQFAEGRSMLSMTSISARVFFASNLRPSCSGNAWKWRQRLPEREAAPVTGVPMRVVNIRFLAATHSRQFAKGAHAGNH
jgi:hypothetical protein